MNNPTKHEVMASIASRRIAIEEITVVINELEKKIIKLRQHKEELKSLNFLDNILLRELKDGTD